MRVALGVALMVGYIDNGGELRPMPAGSHAPELEKDEAAAAGVEGIDSARERPAVAASVDFPVGAHGAELGEKQVGRAEPDLDVKPLRASEPANAREEAHLPKPAAEQPVTVGIPTLERQIPVAGAVPLSSLVETGSETKAEQQSNLAGTPEQQKFENSVAQAGRAIETNKKAAKAEKEAHQYTVATDLEKRAALTKLKHVESGMQNSMTVAVGFAIVFA